MVFANRFANAFKSGDSGGSGTTAVPAAFRIWSKDWVVPCVAVMDQIAGPDKLSAPPVTSRATCFILGSFGFSPIPPSTIRRFCTWR
jgi:hypothetical protein